MEFPKLLRREQNRRSKIPMKRCELEAAFSEFQEVSRGVKQEVEQLGQLMEKALLEIHELDTVSARMQLIQELGILTKEDCFQCPVISKLKEVLKVSTH